MWTIQKLYKEGTEMLAEARIAEASVDAWYLMEHITGITRTAYYADPGREITKEEERRYRETLEKRRRRIPLQHITGEQEFMGYSFLVNEHVLIPRQDTEVLVEAALQKLDCGMRILDLCTGSGCILLSLMKMGREKMGITGLTGTGTDLSEEALKVASANRYRLCKEPVAADREQPCSIPKPEAIGGSEAVTLLQSDLFERVEGVYDMILSNPPYIRTDVIAGLQEEVRLHDPWIALDGKADGLYFYRRIVADSVEYIAPGGSLLFETGHDQGTAVKKLMEEAGYTDVCIKKDLAGLDRVVTGMYYKE